MNVRSNDEENTREELEQNQSQIQWNQRICSRITPLGKVRAGVHSFYPHTRTGTQTWAVLRKLKEPPSRGQHPAPLGIAPPPTQHSWSLWAGHFSAQKPFMTPLSLWTKANFTICSSLPFQTFLKHSLKQHKPRPQAHPILHQSLNMPTHFLCGALAHVFCLVDYSHHHSLSLSSPKASSLIQPFFLEHLWPPPNYISCCFGACPDLV